jgi:hypothetical protein
MSKLSRLVLSDDPLSEAIDDLLSPAADGASNPSPTPTKPEGGPLGANPKPATSPDNFEVSASEPPSTSPGGRLAGLHLRSIQAAPDNATLTTIYSAAPATNAAPKGGTL